MDPTKLFAACFVGSLVVTWLLTPLVAPLARRLGAVDDPDPRKLHRQPTPHLGGLAIFGGLVIGSLAYGFFMGWDRFFGMFASESHLALLVPCGLVFAVGLLDDFIALSPYTRIAVQALAASMLMQSGYVIDKIVLPPEGTIDLGLLAFPITLLWYVGVTNSFNLIDGLDGLMATVGAIALIGIAMVGMWSGPVATPAFALALAGALVGFLYWNWHPARTFAGDSGSLLVGFVIAALALKVSRAPSTAAISLHVPLLLCALPAAETFLTLARRYVSGQGFFSPDRGHIHHVLLQKGFTVSRAVFLLGIVQVLFVGSAVVITYLQGWPTLLPAGFAVALILLGTWWLGYPELRLMARQLTGRLLQRRRRGLAELLAVMRAGELVAEARTLDELQEKLREAVTEGRFAFLALEFTEDLADRLGERRRVIECHNEAAAAYQAGCGDGPCWLFSLDGRPADETNAATGAIRYTLPLAVDGKFYGRLVCQRDQDLQTPAPSQQDLMVYLARPIRDVLAKQPPAEKA